MNVKDAGRKGGKSKSDEKKAAAAQNLIKAREMKKVMGKVDKQIGGAIKRLGS